MTTATTPQDGLLPALLAFQADAPHIPLDATNPHFTSRFSSLPNILKIVRPKLAEHGLVWTTLPSIGESGPTLRYRLAHAPTGEAIDGEMPLMLAKPDPQGLGSALTYARRYALCAVLSLAGDDDDDGNAGSTPAAGVANGAEKPRLSAREPRDTEQLASGKQKGLVNARAADKSLTQTELLNVIRAAAGQEPATDSVTDETAAATVKRMLDRLPARLVDPILEGIKTAQDPAPDAGVPA